VKTGDSNGEAADRSFNFIIFGANPVSEAGTIFEIILLLLLSF
jgi:hypothetical protein